MFTLRQLFIFELISNRKNIIIKTTLFDKFDLKSTIKDYSITKEIKKKNIYIYMYVYRHIYSAQIFTKV